MEVLLVLIIFNNSGAHNSLEAMLCIYTKHRAAERMTHDTCTGFGDAGHFLLMTCSRDGIIRPRVS